MLNKIRRVFELFFFFLLLFYPLITWWALSHSDNITLVASILMAIVSMRFMTMKTRRDSLLTMLPFILSALFLSVSALTNDKTWMLWQPAMINLAMLFAFAMSMRHPPCVAERLARLREPNLPPEAALYCRKVTRAWCHFFFANGCVAALSVYQEPAVWALYNGCIAYILIGLMFTVELFIRRRVKARIAAKQVQGQI